MRQKVVMGILCNVRVDLLHAPRKENRSEEHTSELQSQSNLVCRLLLEKKKVCIRSTPLTCGSQPRLRRVARFVSTTCARFDTYQRSTPGGPLSPRPPSQFAATARGPSA